MKIKLKAIIRTKICRKIISFIIGCGAWWVMGEWHVTTMTLAVPLLWYNVNDQYRIESPETIAITLRGKRQDLRNIDFTTLAIHEDARAISSTKPHRLIISEEDLFLPPTVKLVSYTPLNIKINCCKA